MLEKLLKKHYNQLPGGPDLLARLTSFLLANERVRDQRIFFIKQITKIADQYRERQELAEYDERLFQYNLDGIERIESGDVSGLIPAQCTRLVAHFHSYAANSARRIYEQGGEEWAIRWYHHSLQSAKLESGPRAAHCYSYAGDAARELFFRSDDAQVLENCIAHYDCFLNYLETHPNSRLNHVISKITRKKTQMQKLRRSLI